MALTIPEGDARGDTATFAAIADDVGTELTVAAVAVSAHGSMEARGRTTATMAMHFSTPSRREMSLRLGRASRTNRGRTDNLDGRVMAIAESEVER